MPTLIRLLALVWALSSVCANVFGNSALAGGRLLVPSDVLQVSVVNQAELNTVVRIGPDGTIALPYIGRIRAAGLTEDQLKARVTAGLRRADVIKNPQVLIEVTNFGTQVSVTGAVGSPGVLTLDRPTTLTQILSRAGGIREEAGASTVLLKRRGPNGQRIFRYDAKAILSGKANGANIFLQNNDEVYVEQGAVYYLYGFVNHAGSFPLSRPLNVQQALAVGGGISPLGSEWRIAIRRRLPNGGVEEIPASLDDDVHAEDTIVVNERFF